MAVPLDKLQEKLRFTAPLKPLVMVRLDQVVEPGVLELSDRMVNARVRLHPELPPTELWTYEDDYPGRVYSVRRGQNDAASANVQGTALCQDFLVKLRAGCNEIEDALRAADLKALRALTIEKHRKRE